MPASKLISDIRYFETDVRLVDGTSAKYLGRLVEEPVSALPSIGKRIALKLRELGFATGDFDCVHICLSSALDAGDICVALRTYRGLLKRIRQFETGVDFAAINQLSPLDRDEWFAKTTFEVLRFIASDDEERLALILQVEQLHNDLGENMQIVRKSKSTKTYDITVTFQIASHPNTSSAWLRYHDKRTGETRSGKFLDLSVYGSIFPLVGSIALKQRQIVLTPNASARADVWTEEYETPIIVPLELLDVV